MSLFDNIMGYTAEKTALKQIADTLKNRAVYQKLGVSSPRGLLLHGEPGVGKTLMANALIEASGRKVYTCRKDQPAGEFTKVIKTTFLTAVRNAPSIVFLDDMDKFTNGDSEHKDAEEYVTVQSCIDTVRDKEVFVLATANDIDNLPDSLLRAGRFDRVIEVSAPCGNDAIAVITHYLNEKKFVSGIDAETIARIMDGRSCAELETVINKAGLCAGYERADEITMEHFMDACMRTVFEVPAGAYDNADIDNINSSDGNSEIAQVIYHEAGHAVVSEILCPESVTLVSAHNKKGRSGGFTSYYDNHTCTPYKWRQTRIVGALGGKAAIEQKFGIMDIGTESDLSYAFGHTKKLINTHCACGLQLHSLGYSYSEDIIARQEQAAAVEMERYYLKAKEIIALNGEFFEKIAEALAKKGLITMSDIKAIKETCNIVSVDI